MPKPPIVLVPHDPHWARAFEEARVAIMEACGDHVLDVLHVGSTAIPGLAAKPVIDLMALLRRHDDAFACVSAMAALGFEFRGEAGIGGRHFFRKRHPRTHHVHMYRSDHPEVGRHIRFRDYMRQHPEEGSAYEVLKRDLAARFGGDTRAYSAAKTEFCARIDQLALDAGMQGAAAHASIRSKS
jgi:GrpB-like predicted nucleotidyltransferase (UPF0157 family)